MMFKRKKKKTGAQTPEYRSEAPMPPVRPPKPPTSGSNAVKPNLNYVPPASVKKLCPYELPCGWCTKWDKKCDKKIGCGNDKPQRGLRENIMVLDEAMNPCTFCESYEYGDPKCPTCRENNYKFYKFKENSND